MSRVLMVCIFVIVSFVVCTHAQDSQLCPGENEEFFKCGACDNRCGVLVDCPQPMCIEGTQGSCGCKSGYVRNNQEQCVHRHQCDSSISRFGK